MHSSTCLERRTPSPKLGGSPELVLLTAALVTPAALASSLDVHPIRIELASSGDVGAISFRNQGRVAVSLQAQPARWSQADGKSLFVATDEIVVSPPAFDLEPGVEQVVRIGLRGPVERTSERAYRVFFTELPGWPAAEAVGLKVNLSLAIPVFVAPESRLQGLLKWSLTALADGRIELGLHNAGNEHVQVKQVLLTEASSDRELGTATALGYVLAGQKRRWTIEPAADYDWTATPANFIVSALTDRSPSVSDALVERR